jgi:hypothetical protein
VDSTEDSHGLQRAGRGALALSIPGEWGALGEGAWEAGLLLSGLDGCYGVDAVLGPTALETAGLGLVGSSNCGNGGTIRGR